MAERSPDERSGNRRLPFTCRRRLSFGGCPDAPHALALRAWRWVNLAAGSGKPLDRRKTSAIAGQALTLRPICFQFLHLKAKLALTIARTDARTIGRIVGTPPFRRNQSTITVVTLQPTRRISGR
jgi:hypothetical protein